MTSWLTCLLIHHSPHPVCEQLHYCPSAHSAAILQPLVLNNPTFCNNLLCFFSLQSWLIPAMICVLKAKSGQPIALFKNLLTTSLCNKTKSKVLVLRKTSLFVTWRLCLSGCSSTHSLLFYVAHQANTPSMVMIYRSILLCMLLPLTLGSIPGLGRSPGGGRVFQYSCLENPHGQRSLVGYSPWGCKESDMTERLSTTHLSFRGSNSEKICNMSCRLICIFWFSIDPKTSYFCEWDPNFWRADTFPTIPESFSHGDDARAGHLCIGCVGLSV